MTELVGILLVLFLHGVTAMTHMTHAAPSVPIVATADHLTPADIAVATQAEHGEAE